LLNYILRSMTEDVRFAIRLMKRSLGLTSVAVLSLALGSGATISIFSVIYALALRSLPVTHPERLVEVGRGDGANLHTYAEWKIFRGRQNIFSGVLAYNFFDTSFTVTNPKGQRDVTGLYVSGDYFSTLGVSAALGRVLAASDDQPGAPPVCVLGFELWRELDDPSEPILGRPLRVDGNEFRVVGVAPRPFFGVDVGTKPEIFMPLEVERAYKDYPLLYGRHTPSLDDPRATLLSFDGRLKPEVSLSKANAGLQVLGPQISQALSSGASENGGRPPTRRSLVAHPVTSDMWLQDMDVMLLLMAMAAVALVIACANLGNLLLARAAKRRSEIATRLALGASRRRLMRQMLTESAALSVAGAAGGLLIARWGTQVLLWAISYSDEPVFLDFSWDAKLVGFAVGITLLSAILFGMVPAIQATHVALYSDMKSIVTTGKRRNQFMNSALVVAQVALSVTLLVCAGLLARTLQALLSKDLGFDPKGVLVAHTEWQGPNESPQRQAMIGSELLTEIRSLPGVTSASWTRAFSKTSLPQLVVPGAGGTERQAGVYLIFVSSDYFTTRRTSLRAGRDFMSADTDTSFPVAILSEALARTLFGSVNPVGQRFRENDRDSNGKDFTVEVVGVAEDMQYRRPSDGPLPILFRPVSQCANSCAGMGGFEIRAAGPFARTTQSVENVAATVDPHIHVTCEALSNATSTVIHRNRAMALIAAAFALFVTLLAMIGVYGVTAYATAERTREIGIRMALGAQRSKVSRMLFGEMMRVVCIGVAVGLGAAVPAAQLIRALIWGVKPTDPLSIGVAGGLMLLIAGIAAFFPARRAMSVDPMVALRDE